GRRPSWRDAESEVSFNWPGQRKRPDQGVLEGRLAQRQKRQPAPEREPERPKEAPPAPPKAQPPARREDVTPPGRTDRWIVTELRRQAVTTEASLRDVNGRLDQVSRTLRQIVDYLPRLQPRGPMSPTAAASHHAESVLSQRIDELEARIEARFDELAGAASALRSRGAAPSRTPPTPLPVDTGAIKAEVHD